MKRITMIGLAVLAAMSIASLAAAQDENAVDEKKLFTDKKCNVCHSIEAVGIKKKPNQKPPDLSTVGSEKTAEFLVKYLKKQETIEGRKHMGTFKGSDEELEALTKWLGSLKSNKE